MAAKASVAVQASHGHVSFLHLLSINVKYSFEDLCILFPSVNVRRFWWISMSQLDGDNPQTILWSVPRGHMLGQEGSQFWVQEVHSGNQPWKIENSRTKWRSSYSSWEKISTTFYNYIGAIAMWITGESPVVKPWSQGTSARQKNHPQNLCTRHSPGRLDTFGHQVTIGDLWSLLVSYGFLHGWGWDVVFHRFPMPKTSSHASSKQNATKALAWQQPVVCGLEVTWKDWSESKSCWNTDLGQVLLAKDSSASSFRPI